MSNHAKRFGEKYANLIAAWGTFAPETKFAGMSLGEFKVALARSIDTRSQIEDFRLQIKGLIAARTVGDQEGQEVVARIVAGVLADADHGPNSALYRALNYVPKIERASGLTVKTETTNAATTSTTVTSAASLNPTVSSPHEAGTITATSSSSAPSTL